MASLTQWANEPWPGPLPFDRHWVPLGIPEHPTKLQVMAALRKIDTGGYGIISGGGIYGREGLEQEEAFVWMELRAFVNGWIQGTDQVESEKFFLAIKAEWARVEALTAAEERAPTEPPP